MPGTKQADALVLADSLRQQVPVILNQTLRYASTISGGVAEFGPPDRFSTDILTRADQGLYQAKRAGRNRVAAL